MSGSLKSETRVEQSFNTAGHYQIYPVEIDIPAGQILYTDLPVDQDWEWQNCHVSFEGANEGDKIVCGKLLAGKIGSTLALASAGATVINVVSTPGVLRVTKEGGRIDKGFYLSFGVENTSAGVLNQRITGSPENPNQELKEYKIKVIGEPILSGGVEIVPITIEPPLAENISAGTDTNLVVRVAPKQMRVTPRDRWDIGQEVLDSGFLPGGSKLRFGYFNNGQTTRFFNAYLSVRY